MATSSNIKVERSARFISPKGRASYPHLFTPQAFEGGDPKYQLTLMLPKGDVADNYLVTLRKSQESAISALYPKKKPAQFDQFGVNDGDDNDDPEMHGHWLIKATNKARPACVDRNGQEIVESSVIYGGCYVRANICAKAYGTPSKGGVSLELVAVQFIEDGTPFSASMRAISEGANEFADADM